MPDAWKIRNPTAVFLYCRLINGRGAKKAIESNIGDKSRMRKKNRKNELDPIPTREILEKSLACSIWKQKFPRECVCGALKVVPLDRAVASALRTWLSRYQPAGESDKKIVSRIFRLWSWMLIYF